MKLKLKTTASTILLCALAITISNAAQSDKPEFSNSGSGIATDSVAATISRDSIPQIAANDSISLDSIGLDTTLEDLVVVGKKKLVESDGAKLTYNVTEDPEAQVSTTMQILRKVPGVTVDANDNVKVNGSSSFKIFLNGKEDPMLSGDVKTVLKSMPASSIRKIEVISEPGAKYDAEGAGGILNIVTTTKQNLEGYLINANYNLNSRNTGGGLYGRTKYRNVTGSANVYYSHSIFEKYFEGSSHAEYENLASETDRLQISDSKGNNTNGFIGGNVSLSWEPDTLNLISFSFNGNKWNGNSKNPTSMRMYDSKGGLTYSLDRLTSSGYTGNSISSFLSYQHTFRKEGHHIVLSYSYSHSKGQNDSQIETTEAYNYPGKYDVWSVGDYGNNSDTHVFQIDYANPLTPKHLIEVGAKGTITDNNSDNAQYYGPTLNELVLNDAEHSKLSQFDDILAAYASYTGSYNKWSVRAGLRYEYTRRGIHYRLKQPGYSDFTNNLNDLVPNASVTYRFGSAQNVRAAYQMRISRPGIYILNPFRNTLTPGRVSYGNPDLKSAKNHIISLSYSNYGGKLSGEFKTNYLFSNNSITDIIFSNQDGVNTTYANIGRSQSVSFQLNLTWNIHRNFNVGIYANERYEHYKADSELLHKSLAYWATNLNANADYRAPFGIRISGYGGYGSAWKDIQSTGSDWYYYGLSLSKSFLKEDRLTLNISAQNFLPATRSSKWSQSSESARITSSYEYKQWYVGASISWRFGELKSDVKRTDANMEEQTTVGTNSNKS